ncbi:HAD family hydrolase [Solicola gregarius]|uniref:Uncharacterized protein n=1 Tax=Solicola gregarius TaxID=2908642 RepID=A0AA46TK68_9ACTN|nr:hypothetical protein [Solicola gregarius]UYM06605.1 hypothetical protein L0C25_05915 [Solicola gregarius]
MSRTLWLHLGTFKSGSSRIQQEAWRQRDDLQQHGWLYPMTGVVTDEPEVGHRHSHLVYYRNDAEVWPELLEGLVTEVGTSDATNVLMSSEAWSDPYAAPALTETLTALRTAGAVDDVRGVLYLRNRYDYARSLYREMTRRRANVRPLHEWVDLPRRQRMLNPLVVVRSLTKTLDPGSVEAYPYEGSGDIGQHFFGLLGLTAAPQSRPANPGLDALEAEAYRQLKLLAPELQDHWPGLYSLSPRERWPVDVTERFGPGQLDIDQGWRRRFRRLTGWSREEVDRLLARPVDSGEDVLTYSDEVRTVVETWLGVRSRRGTDSRQ